MSPTAALMSIPTQTAFPSSEVLWFKSSKLRPLRALLCLIHVLQVCFWSNSRERPGTRAQPNWLNCSDSAIPVFRLGPFPRVLSSKVAAVKGRASEKPRQRGSSSVSRKETQEMTRRKRGKREVGRYMRWAPTCGEEAGRRRPAPYLYRRRRRSYLWLQQTVH